jgi:gliding motility-associated-like protein
MTPNFSSYRFILFLSFFFIQFWASAQVTVTSSDSLSCTVPCTVLTANVVGDAPTNSGITVDDIYSGVLPIGFTFNFYGTNHTNVVIGPNGTLCFDLTLAGAFDPWPISAVLLGNPSKFNNICGPWCDIDISTPDGGTITYSLTGAAPFRKYIVTFCRDRMFSCTTQITSTQIILYETTNIIECHIATKPVCATWNSGRAIIGVQNATGTAATVAPGRDFPAVYTCTNEAWRFTPNATVSSYTVASIVYAPIPYATSPVYWYNDNTGAYLGVGLTQTVCPTVTTRYKAGALGCADTSFGYYTVTPSPSFTISLTSTNPTLCEACDGTITVSGFTPGLLDTITYELGGVPQPPVYAIASAAGTVTITGLCAGTYTNFIGRQGACVSPPAGPVVLTNPPIVIDNIVPVPQSICGACDGSLIINGLYPSRIFTINYSFNGVPQPPVTTSTNAAGSITLLGLCEGVYDNIIASFGTCITPPMGPYTLGGPPPPPAVIATIVNPTECGFCNGSITIRSVAPYSSDTIRYSYNGVPQPPIVTVALGDSSIFLPGLCEGLYSGISIKIGNCITTVLGSATLAAPPISVAFDTTVSLGCSGDTVFFYNNSTSPGPLRYVWYFGDGQTDTATNPYHVYAAGSYTVTLLATNGFCADSLKREIVLGHPLNAEFTRTPAIICQNEPVTFTNTSIGATKYIWSFGNGATSTTDVPAYSYQNSGVYTIRLIASNDIPCYDTTTQIIEVDTISGMKMEMTDTVLCAGTYITFTGLYAGLGNTGVTWSFGDGDSIKNVNPVYHAYGGQNVYTVTVTANYRACPSVSATRSVTVVPQPTISLGGDTAICKGSEAILLSDIYNATNPLASWLWSTGEVSKSIYIVAPGVYYATVTINNCSNTDSVYVANDCYVDIPNVFTPNGDGINDFFFPRSLLASGLTSFKMNIYNRWGQQIFESTSLDGSGWDGRLNGVQQPSGVYVYTIDVTFKDGQKENHKGNVTLMR